MKIKTLFLILIAGILFTILNSMPLANAQPIQTSLTITSPPYLPRDIECTMEAILKDEDDNPLEDFDIDFLYTCDDDHTHKICTVKTNSSGVASLELAGDIPPYFYYPTLSPFETRKTYMFKIYAVFDGTTTYAKSSSEYVYVTFVLTDYSQYWVGGGLIATVIMGFVGYIVFRRTRKKK